MEAFLRLHKAQFNALNIPECLLGELFERLTACCRVKNGGIDVDHLLTHTVPATETDSPLGAMFVVPHVINWDISNHKGMLNELNELSDLALRILYKALHDQVWSSDSDPIADLDAEDMTRPDLVNAILQPATWSRVLLYRAHDNTIRAALPAPPYYPQCSMDQEADLTGPFPFRYCMGKHVTDISLVYLSPDMTDQTAVPTLDLVPPHSCPNDATRHIRYAALLGQRAPAEAVATAKLLYAEFTREHHFKRQAKLETDAIAETSDNPSKQDDISSAPNSGILRVYTDSNDPMKLGHKESGLDPAKYELVERLDDADIIFSYQSIFAASSDVYSFLQTTSRTLFVNQFPYEGAFVQKDHLALEVLKQHGLPRPSWSIESYDLYTQLGVFAGAAVLAREQGEGPPVWIVKPARGTQSKGHLITRSTAHILRLVDAGIQSWVVQRYIERPVCYQGRKVDCRCIVLLCDAKWKPTLYMHNRVYFRIANKVHSVELESDLLDHESVLTANHLLTGDHRSTEEPLRTLPVDTKTIASLEHQYLGFDWNGLVLPAIHDMIRDLFNGMTRGFPGMADGQHCSRAVYGVDVMFQVETDDSITPKLTEVTFCPANNATCDAYERDEELYRSYNTDVFDCLYRNQVSGRFTKLQ